MPDLPTTRAEALSLGLTRYFTGKPCKHGHIAERHAGKGNCVECVRERLRQWIADNPEKVREKYRKWAKANPERVREGERRWVKANPEKKREGDRRWRAENAAKERERKRKWSAANRDKHNAVQATRRARKSNATPPWVNMAAIKSIYAKCARVSAETGIEHHVDHIVPLKGRNVCGLHVETNLQVLTASENISKGNR